MEAGAIAVRRVRKEDMRHVAKATGATLVRSSVLSVIILVNSQGLNSLSGWSIGFNIR